MGAQSNRNSFACFCSVLLILTGIVLILLGGGADSPNSVGAYGVEWHEANCTIVEFRTQLLASSTERVIYRVNVTAPNGTLISPDLGATAVAGEFGWGGYTDKRGENSHERAQNETKEHPKGMHHICYYSSSFLEYPAPASCKRCTELVYFHYDTAELEKFQSNWMLFMAFGGTLIGLAVIMIALGVTSLICHYKSKHRRPKSF